MMGKKQHLGACCQFRENLKAEPCASVIKANENVVYNKGHRLPLAQMLFKRCET